MTEYDGMTAEMFSDGNPHNGMIFQRTDRTKAINDRKCLEYLTSLQEYKGDKEDRIFVSFYYVVNGKFSCRKQEPVCPLLLLYSMP